MTTPYRELDTREASTAPTALECWLRDGDQKRWLRALYVKGWLTLTACLSLFAAGAQLPAALVALGGMAWGYVDVRGRRGARVAVTVDRDRAKFVAGHSPEPIDVALDDLLDVRLDSKCASKNMTVARADGVNSVFGMGSNHNIDIDIARIELVVHDHEPILLGRDFISGSLCTDTLRSIRLFLRAHGWKPADERDES